MLCAFHMIAQLRMRHNNVNFELSLSEACIIPDRLVSAREVACERNSEHDMMLEPKKLLNDVMVM